MSGILQRSEQNNRDLELVDSVMGSATACFNISKKVANLESTTAGCLSGPLSHLTRHFLKISSSYTTAKILLQHPNAVWDDNVSRSIKLTQRRCQQTATELSAILDQYGEWDVLATVESCQHVNMLSKSLEVLLTHHDLLFGVLKLVPILAQRPAEHERPDSIIIPDYLPGSESNFTQSDWQEWRQIRARIRAAEAAAEVMNDWSVECMKSLDLIRDTIRLAKERSKELLAYQIAKEPFLEQATQPLISEELPIMDDWSATQSTTGIMTPTEDWSDLGSDTTEIAHTPAITRHSLQLCGYATANFLRLANKVQSSLVGASDAASVSAEDLQCLHKAYDELVVLLLHALDAPVLSESHLSLFFRSSQVVSFFDLTHAIQETGSFMNANNDIEQSFGHLPGSTPLGTADIRFMHNAYRNLVRRLLFKLSAPIPFQDDRFAPTPAPAPAFSVPAPAREVLRPATLEVQSEICIDKTLEIIIDSMEPTPTDKDIMKLVFHWTTMEECNGFKSAEVMKFD